MEPYTTVTKKVVGVFVKCVFITATSATQWNNRSAQEPRCDLQIWKLWITSLDLKEAGWFTL
jgi:hypothetical protein